MTIQCTLLTLTQLFMGDLPIERARASGRLKLLGAATDQDHAALVRLDAVRRGQTRLSQQGSVIVALTGECV
jgi:hypothetical protein